ncbi:MAG: bifunctional diaminohydroxyphosphoribosylaminopyrimidine deaminase/5-amino-6-(5-phosphoribosylamino)uracil reductase RibD, partial [Acidobacteriota bacterium]
MKKTNPHRPFTDRETAWMKRALRLAARGLGQTSPNPMVGAVLVRNGRIVGAGYHRYNQRLHAEIVALQQAGPRARGATLYVTLEPCSHQGRTPPCADALAGAGVAGVVAAMTDPSAKVGGRGFGRLRRAGIPVRVGLLEAQAQRLNEAFIHFTTAGRPLVVLKTAMTLDGRIATATGQSRWITSQRARRLGQRWRLAADAILVGSGTIIKDDPALSYRLRQPRVRPLIKVVLDGRLRTPVSARVLDRSRGETCLIFCSKSAPASRRKSLEAAGAEVVSVDSKRGMLDLESVLVELGRRQVTSLLVEGGGQAHWSFVRAGLAGKLVAVIAPAILGGGAVAAVGGAGFSRLEDAARLSDLRVRRLGDEIVVEGYFKVGNQNVAPAARPVAFS